MATMLSEMAPNKLSSVNAKESRADMKTAYLASVIFGIVLSSCVVAVQFQPAIQYVLGVGFGALGLLVVMVACLIMGLKWRKVSFLPWLGPLALSAGFLLMIPLARWLGQSAIDWRFKARIQDYTAAVEDIRSGKVATQETLSNVVIKKSLLEVKDVKAMRKPDGSVVVLFLTGTGFPLIHAGYLFNGSGTNVACLGEFNTLSNKFVLRKVADGWYHFSD